MEWELSRAEARAFDFVDASPSTNTELVARAADAGAVPDFSVLVTTNQTAGRGRLGRVWVAPPGKTLAISVLLRPMLPAGEPLELTHFGWLPLLAGVAMATAVESVITEPRVGLKWPNDVQVDGLKVAGLLAELVPGGGGTDGNAVVIGAGLNLTMAAGELPTVSSTSLGLAGAPVDSPGSADAVLAAYLRALRSLYTGFVRLGADADASGLRELVREKCTTLGQQVRVELPGGSDLFGTATDIDRSGRLVVRSSADGQITAVAAGDVTHLRYE